MLVRFLHLQRRLVQGMSADGEPQDVGTLDVDGTEYTSWDEAAEREQRVTAEVSALLAGDKHMEFHVGAGEATEDLTDSRGRLAGRLIRQWAGLDGVIRLHAERVSRPVPGAEAAGAAGERVRPRRRAAQPRRRPAQCAHRRALPDRQCLAGRSCR